MWSPAERGSQPLAGAGGSNPCSWGDVSDLFVRDRHRPSSSPHPQHTTAACAALPACLGYLFVVCVSAKADSSVMPPSSLPLGDRLIIPETAQGQMGEVPECFAGLVPCLEAQT